MPLCVHEHIVRSAVQVWVSERDWAEGPLLRAQVCVTPSVQMCLATPAQARQLAQISAAIAEGRDD